MLWPRFLVFFSLVAAVTGCGFRPMLEHNPHPIEVALSVNGAEGYLNHVFYQQLKRELALLPKTEPLKVKVDLSQILYDMSYGKDATALRSQNVMIASYEIWQKGKLLKKGKVDSISSYNLDRNDEFATLTSRMGSDDKVIKAIASEMAREVFLSLHS